MSRWPLHEPVAHRLFSMHATSMATSTILRQSNYIRLPAHNREVSYLTIGPGNWHKATVAGVCATSPSMSVLFVSLNEHLAQKVNFSQKP